MSKNSQQQDIGTKRNQSIITFDLRPMDDAVDVNAIKNQILNWKKEGMEWQSGTLIPVAFGIHKIRVSVQIDDDTVSIADIEEMLGTAEMSEAIATYDIVAFTRV